MKICVTGGAGFIGSHVADLFLSNGHEVVVVDNFSTGRQENVPAAARLVTMNINSDAFDALMDAEKFDVVSHHGAHMELRVSVEKPLHDAEVNVLGSLRVLEAARRNHVRNVVLASTGGGIYGEQEYYPADEQHPIRPLSPYGVGKRTMEMYAEYYRRVHGLKVASLRYTNIYGPRQNPFGEAGVIAIFLNKWLTGHTATINGDGTQTRDYVHVYDVARANFAAVNANLNDTYNVATGIETSLLDLVSIMRKSLSVPAPTQHAEGKTGDLARNVCTSEKLQKACEWKPLVGIEKGLSETVEWFVGKTSR